MSVPQVCSSLRDALQASTKAQAHLRQNDAFEVPFIAKMCYDWLDICTKDQQRRRTLKTRLARYSFTSPQGIPRDMLYKVLQDVLGSRATATHIRDTLDAACPRLQPIPICAPQSIAGGDAGQPDGALVAVEEALGQMHESLPHYVPTSLPDAVIVRRDSESSSWHVDFEKLAAMSKPDLIDKAIVSIREHCELQE